MLDSLERERGSSGGQARAERATAVNKAISVVCKRNVLETYYSRATNFARLFFC